MQQLETHDPPAPVVSFRQLLLILAAVLVGTVTAAVVLPIWLPGISHSLVASEPKAYWYLSRASGFVAYGLLWLSMVLGLLITNRFARVWPGGPLAVDMHQYGSILALAFVLFHGLILLGDQYIGYTWLQLVVPFASLEYQPLAVGAGQLATWLLVPLILSFYVKQKIGRPLWRAIHMTSFAVFLLALVHGLASGTDSDRIWAIMLYWVSGGSVLLLTVYRVLMARLPHTAERPRAT